MTGLPSVWEEVWDRLNVFLLTVVESLRPGNAALWYQIFHSENEAFPFRGGISFVRSGDPASSDEDIVLSLDFKLAEGLLRATVDIARGDGEILAEAAVAAIRLATDTAGLRQAICDAELAAESFIREQQTLLEKELCTAE